MKTILTALLLGSLFVETSNATPVELTVPFAGQQPDAPGGFNLWLEDNYRLWEDGLLHLKFSLLEIRNDGPPDSQIIAFFLYDPANLIAGGGQNGNAGGNFWADNRGPRVVPADIENAFPVQYWFPIRNDKLNDEGELVPSGPGPMPGEHWGLVADFAHGSLVDAFNSGNFKAGLLLADGHTYIAAIPDATSSLVLLALAAVVLFRIQRGVSAHRMT